MIEKITISGKKYPVKFGNGAIRRFCKNHEPPIDNLNDYYDYIQSLKDLSNLTFAQFDDLALLIYSAIDSGCNLTGIDLDLTFDKLYESLGDDLTIIPDVLKIYSNSIPQTEKKKINPENQKK